MTSLAITGGRLILGDRVESASLLIEDGRIARIGGEVPTGVRIIDARGKHVAPGIVDLGVFAIDLPAFTAGGITRAALMPDQSRPLDDVGLVQRAAAAGKPAVWIHPMAAATRNLEGAELAEVALMQRGGACAIATGRRRIADSGVMYRLLAYAAAFDMLVVSHAEDEGLTANAVATDGETATRLGLASAPASAEAIAIGRDIALAEETGARLHFRQVTTAAGFRLIRAAKKRDVRVTCGVTPAHLLLSETAIGPFKTFARLSPPLRSEDDRKATLDAVADGTIDVICSGHDPRGPEAKRLPYADAEPGMSGAETLAALALTLVRDGLVDLPRLFTLLSANPARLLGLPGGTIAEGAEADLILLDPDAPWIIDGETFVSTAGNTPFDALPVQGRVLTTIKGGQPLG
ncbi:dihydroorotase [Sphingomonas sp. ID0503]|uniref:dihydroorotase n=1 Tax=Sphingomonas sp. ID0503 TaxID=3399691 RepID=UPI003AFAF022